MAQQVKVPTELSSVPGARVEEEEDNWPELSLISSTYAVARQSTHTIGRC